MRVIAIYLFLMSAVFATPPNWYINQSIKNKNYEIIGYGEGKTLDEAKQIAKSDIAKSHQKC